MSEEIKTPIELLAAEDAALSNAAETVESVPFSQDAPDLLTPAPPRLIEKRAMTATTILKSEAALPPEIEDLVSPSVRAMLVVATAPERKMARVRRRVVAYLRYSSVNQRPESLARQEELLRLFADMNDLEIVKVYVDAAVSGTIRHRRGLDGALDFIMEGGADGLLVEDCDRLARRFTIIPTIYEQLTQARKQLWDRRHGIIDSELKAAIVAAMASSDYRKLRERLHIGRRKLIENGYITTAAYGYASVPGQPGARVIVSEQAEIVREIFRLFVDESKSYFQIARNLNVQGSHPMRGPLWRARGVSSILANPLYKGLYIYGRKTDEDSETEDHSFDTLMVPVPHLAIVDVALWNAAEARRAECEPGAETREVYSRGLSVRRAYATSDFLSRRVVCGLCDVPMWKQSYRTAGRHRRVIVCVSAEYVVNHPRVHADEIRKLVLEEVGTLVSGAEHQERFIAHWTEGRQRREAELKAAVSRVQAQITTVNAQIEESWESDWMSGYSNDMKAERRRQLEARIRSLRARKEETSAELRAFAAQERHRQSLMKKLAILAEPDAQSSQAAGVGEALAAVGSILRRVTIQYVEEDNRFDIFVELCPNGDAAAADPLVITRERKLWQIHGGISQAYFDLVRQHREAGRWRLSDEEFEDLWRFSPGLRRGRMPRDRKKAILEALLCCNETGLTLSSLPRIVDCEPDGVMTAYAKFVERGGKSELEGWLSQNATRDALTPQADFLPANSKLRCLLSL